MTIKNRRPSRKLKNLSAKPVRGDEVKGGKLLEAAVKGKVFKKVEIHVTA